MNIWESVANWLMKSLKFLNPFAKKDIEEEQDRLRVKANEFCDGILTVVENWCVVIEKKVRKVMK